MIRRRLCIALVTALVCLLTACGGADSSSGPTEIAVWHGYQDTEGEVFKNLIDQYNKEHPDVKVTELYSSNDLVLQKVLTAVRGGSTPTSRTCSDRGLRTSPRSVRSSTCPMW